MSFAPTFYEIVSLDALLDSGEASIDAVHPAAAIPNPPLAFGQTDLSAFDVPSGSPPDPSVTAINPAVRVLLHGATVHGPDGVVSVGRKVLNASLHHVDAPRAGAFRDGGLWLIHNQFTALRLAAAEHLLCGHPGNYYHWLLDGLVRAALRDDSGAPCLLPWTGAPFQQSGPALIPGLAAAALTIASHNAVFVARLAWSTSLNGSGTGFHPAIRGIAAAMRAAAVGSGHAAGDSPDIYILRDDSQNRPLRNEAAIAGVCAARGFRPVRLAAMPMAEQVALFAGARRIVAPHGAGLANLLFCNPGTAVLELQMDRYDNWCFRRLAATMELRYGCLIGRAEPGDHGWVHANPWSLDPGRLEAALDDPRFNQET